MTPKEVIAQTLASLNSPASEQESACWSGGSIMAIYRLEAEYILQALYEAGYTFVGMR